MKAMVIAALAFLFQSVAFAAPQVSVIINGQTYSCNGTGSGSADSNEIQSSVDVSCLESMIKRFPGSGLNTVYTFIDKTCRTTVDTSSCYEIAQTPNQACVDEVSSGFPGSGIDTLNEIATQCMTTVYSCR